MQVQKLRALSVILFNLVVLSNEYGYAQQKEKPDTSAVHWYSDSSHTFKLLVPNSAEVSTTQFNQVIFTAKDGSITISTTPNYNQNQDAAAVKNILNKICDTVILSSNGKELSRSMITMNGNPGCEIVASVGGLKMRHRTYLVKARMVQIGITGKSEWVDSPLLKSISSSFVILC